MMDWAKKQLANVAGTQEPIYGPSAIHSVANQTETAPYTELKRDDLRWAAMDSTSVETQTFYLMADNGHLGFVQVIYSNIIGIRTTCQFVTKIFYPRASKSHLWSSNQLSEVEFSDDQVNLYAKNCAVELSEDGTAYTIKSMISETSVVNLKVTRIAPGFQIGTDGKTYFGTDPEKPWGSMRHAFWPKNKLEGTIATTDGPIDFKGISLFVHALQGMKPHHAAAKWNFVDFQGPRYSAVMMEYTTPPSYGSTVVNVGCIVKDDEIISAGASNSAHHTNAKDDEENGWPEPTDVKYVWNGKTKDGEIIEAVIEGPLGARLDRIDVMAETPGFVKKIVAGTVGTKPYIYQYAPQSTEMHMKIKIGDDEAVEHGKLFTEATFISE